MSIDIEKKISVSGPCRCGQIAVSCSLKMILERQPFCCEACGFVFSGEEYPAFLAEAVIAAGADQDRRLFSDMKALYSCCYGASVEIAGDLLKRLSKEYPQYLDRLPLAALPAAMAISRLKENEELAKEFPTKYAETFPWRKLTASDWVALLRILPEMADRCDKWQDFSPAQWMQIKSRNYSLYSLYFNFATLGFENFCCCVAREPRLLEKTVNDAKWGIADAAETIADAVGSLWRKLW